MKNQVITHGHFHVLSSLVQMYAVVFLLMFKIVFIMSQIVRK